MMAEFRQPQHTDPAELVWSPDGKLLAVADRNSDTVIYNIDDADDTKFIPRDDTNFVFSIAFHPDSHHIALAHRRGVNIYDIADTKLIWKVDTPQYTPSNIVYSQDGKLLFIACWHEDEDPFGTNGAVFVYDTTSRQQVYQHLEDKAIIMQVAVDRDNKHFSWSGSDGIVCLCDRSTFDQIDTFEPFKVSSPAISFMKFLGHDAIYVECEDDYACKTYLWLPAKHESHELKQTADLKPYRDLFYPPP